MRSDAVGAGARPHRQGLLNQQPAVTAVPTRAEHIAAGIVNPPGRDIDAVRGEPERPGAAIEEAAEDTGRVECGYAQPVHGAVRCDECTGVAVRQEGIVGDRWEGRPIERHSRLLRAWAALLMIATFLCRLMLVLLGRRREWGVPVRPLAAPAVR